MNLETLATKLLILREQKAELAKQAKKLAEDYDTIELAIKNLLDEQGLKTGTVPAVARLTIVESTVANLDDWDQFLTYCKENDAYYLLTKKIASAKVLELANIQGEDIPGTSKFTKRKLSVTKL